MLGCRYIGVNGMGVVVTLCSKDIYKKENYVGYKYASY